MKIYKQLFYLVLISLSSAQLHAKRITSTMRENTLSCARSCGANIQCRQNCFTKHVENAPAQPAKPAAQSTEKQPTTPKKS